MSKTRTLCSVAILGLVATLFGGCGDGDNTLTKICEPKVSTCLKGNAGQVCNNDGTQQVDFTCAEGEVCTEGGTCEGQCVANEIRCATDAAAQICSADERHWVPIACAAGTKCDPMVGCVPAPDGVQVCTPDAVGCQDGNTVSTCSADGASVDYDDCEANEMCVDGACVFNADAVCVPRTTQCVDGNSQRCKDDGSGYDETVCPDTAPCMDGVCTGTVCVVGDTKCMELSADNLYSGAWNPTVLYTCVDGTSYEVSYCANDESCSYDNVNPDELSTFQEELTAWYENTYNIGGNITPFPTVDLSDSVASCVANECNVPFRYRGVLDNLDLLWAYGSEAQSYACGDPTDATVDPLTGFSTCEGFPPYAPLKWSHTNCLAPTECNYTSYEDAFGNNWTTPICSSNCTPTAQRCAGSGNQEGTETCGADGFYEAVVPCGESPDGYEYVCSENGNFSGLTSGACMDAVCQWWQWEAADGSPEYLDGTYYGACDAQGMFHPCGADGILGAAAACTGFCEVWGSVGGRSGDFVPGACTDECVDGDMQCVGTYFWVECIDGKWSNETNLCPGGDACFTYEDNQGTSNSSDDLSVVLCGGTCTPGTTDCGGVAGEQITTCDDTGTFGAFEDCGEGTCVEDDGTATCEPSCFPGDLFCGTISHDGTTTTVLTKTAADGGATVYTCGDDYRWPAAATDCAASTYCRMDADDVHLGCVQCVGPATGGNVLFGAADKDCSDAATLRTCGANNQWAESACTADSCLEYQAAAIGPYNDGLGLGENISNLAYCSQ